MKNRLDLVRGWLRKAESGRIALNASLEAGALDAACFHAQQAAEKYLKAFLTHAGLDFPPTHNLSKLVELAAGLDPTFRSLLSIVEPLTPYAVQLRYDHEFWPSREVAEEAKSLAEKVRDFILKKLPQEFFEKLP